MNFLWVTLNVNDMDKSVKFYEDIVGLKLDSKFKAGEKTEIAFLKDAKSDTQVELIYNEGTAPIDVGQDYSLGFKVGSVDKMLETVKATNAEVITSILQPQPYIKFFYVLDPDGRKVQFVENINSL